ncbi:hypothetical protein MKW98_015421 [Papaver atlanticum]|uniref:Uncharacterized protein n=1 Tax=Papaver atlanticum TaxID=357466 RepID=A0AAD4RY97_9MAGN|nr:hypothetical protein MKW98_015421 [Papaver atlanticum]
MVWDIAMSLMENMGIHSSSISSSKHLPNEASFFRAAAGWVNAEVYGWKDLPTGATQWLDKEIYFCCGTFKHGLKTGFDETVSYSNNHIVISSYRILICINGKVLVFQQDFKAVCFILRLQVLHF